MNLCCTRQGCTYKQHHPVYHEVYQTLLNTKQTLLNTKHYLIPTISFRIDWSSLAYTFYQLCSILKFSDIISDLLVPIIILFTKEGFRTHSFNDSRCINSINEVSNKSHDTYNI
jgi:hypothetical protein